MTPKEKIASDALVKVSKEQRRGACSITIFGGAGDLTTRKILPALYDSYYHGLLPRGFSIVGAGIPEMSTEAYRKLVQESVEQFSHDKILDKKKIAVFAEGAFYVSGKFDDSEFYKRLEKQLVEISQKRTKCDNRIYYFSVPPSVFGMLAEHLGKHKMSQVTGADHWRRMIVEKPFGTDLASARKLNRDLQTAFAEWQIYRIDHYLGKETVQNIMALRFANGIFEPLWNRNYVDHVQITASETLGVEKRGGYYEQSGALRDMIQNHVMQLVALIAMEPPATFDANAVRDEKAKVLRSIQPISAEEVSDFVVRGQYGDGVIQNEMVQGYRKEPNVNPESATETYVAAKLEIENWRWADVPFYIRTGKRLPKRLTEVAIYFKRTPHLMFRRTREEVVEQNVLVLQIQPDEAISLKFEAKVPGHDMHLRSVDMDFHYSEAFKEKSADAYARLILDCMRGDATLFMRADAVEVGWWLVTPMLEYWQSTKPKDFPNYSAGTWGPVEAELLLHKDGRRWRTP